MPYAVKRFGLFVATIVAAALRIASDDAGGSATALRSTVRPAGRAAQSSSILPRDLTPALISALQLQAGPAYAVQTRSPHRIEASNPAHAFTAAFDDGAVQMRFDIGSQIAAASLDVRLSRFGWAAAPKLPRHTQLAAAGARIEMRRTMQDGSELNEWYLNGPLGLEQGFTIPAPPAAEREATAEIAIEFMLGGGWTAVSEAERAIVLEHPNGARVRYGHLYAFDAHGSPLPARLSSDEDKITVLVDADGAEYPLTIDPLFERQKLTASNGAADDTFGVSVAISGDTAVVGAPGAGVVNQGAAYVFVKSGTTWTQQAQLLPSLASINSAFGISVAVDGDTAVVGASSEDIGGLTDQGSAFVFVRTGTTWAQQAKLLAADGDAGDAFGQSVAVSGNTVLVGAPNDDVGGNTDLGSGYVFVRDGTDWTQQAQLLATDPDPLDFMGGSVALSGDIAILGARGDDVGVNADQGSAVIFVRTDTTWAQEARVQATGGAADDAFGDSVAISGTTALVGAPGTNVIGVVDQGAAYVFVRTLATDPPTWPQQAQLLATNGGAGDFFGDAVALNGDGAIVGASLDDVGSNVDQGSAYSFTRTLGTWTQQEQLLASDGAAGDRFGTAVALGVTGASIVGANLDDVGANANQGSAYVFEPGGPTTPGLTIAPTSGTTAGGTHVTISGANFVAGATVTIGGVAATNVVVVNSTTITAVTGPHAAGASDVVVTSGGVTSILPNGYTYVTPPSDPTTDSDGDGMPDVFEIRHGLDPRVADASGDPDADTRTNLQEFQAGTHPRGFFTRYLAEGATSTFFDVRLAFVNPGTAPASVLLRFLKSDGTTPTHTFPLSGQQRATIDAKTIPGLAVAEFSTIIESDVQVVADRTMTWDATAYGSHAETSIAAPAATWYLAEGATHSGFELFYLIQNPNSAAVVVSVQYLLPNGTTLAKSYGVAANSRSTIWVNGEARLDPLLGLLAATDVSAILTVTSGGPVIVERAMYLNAGGKVFGAGHGSAAVTAPATSWFFAEGATGNFFDLFVLLANPNAQPALVAATYLLPSGAVVNKAYTVAGNSRRTIWVDLEDAALADTAVSTIVTVTNGVPIIAERAMWWPGPSAASWHEAHNAPGATTTGTRWALADGEVGGTTAVETYILIANTSAFPGAATVTLMFEDGTTAQRTFPLAGNSRFNVAIAAEFPAAVGRRFGAVVQSVGATPAQIVVERAMYSNSGGVVWAAGTNVLATRLQ